MKTYVWVSFAFMGWAYYEISGGDDFAPQQRDVEIAQAETAPEVVTRAASPTLLSVSTSNVDQAPQAETAVVIQASAQSADVAPTADTLATQDIVEVAAVVAEQPADIREVAGDRVNMRAGPGTNFDVIVTLENGTELEVLTVDDTGWANVATVDRGIEGWMAERLLTSPDA